MDRGIQNIGFGFGGLLVTEGIGNRRVADQRINGVEEQVLGFPAHGVESQGHANACVARTCGADGLGINIRCIRRFDDHISKSGRNRAVFDIGIGPTQNQIGSNRAVHCNATALAKSAATRGFYGAVGVDFDNGIFMRLNSDQTSRYVTGIHIALDLAANIVAYNQPAHCQGIRVGEVQPVGRKIGERIRLPVTNIAIVSRFEIYISIRPHIFVDAAAIAAISVIIIQAHPVS